MNQEVFVAKLKELVELGRSQGNMITKEQLEVHIGDMNLEEVQMNLIGEYLIENKIGLDESANLEDALTEEEKNYLDQYLEEIKAFDEFSKHEIEVMILQALNGEKEAKDELTEVFLSRVVDIAKLYTGQGVLVEDLIGEGNIALILGISMMGCCEDPSEVEGMLMKMIMDCMEEAISQSLEVAEGDRLVAERMNELSEKVEELVEVFQRKITLEELSKETSYTVDEMRDWILASGTQIEMLEQNEE